MEKVLKIAGEIAILVAAIIIANLILQKMQPACSCGSQQAVVDVTAPDSSDATK